MYREQSPRRELLGTVGIAFNRDAVVVGIRLAWITCLTLSAILGLAIISGEF